MLRRTWQPFEALSLVVSHQAREYLHVSFDRHLTQVLLYLVSQRKPYYYGDEFWSSSRQITSCVEG